MRSGWNPELARLLQRPVPTARVLTEAVVTTAEDVRSRREEWDAADSLSGLETLASGGVRLSAGAAQQHASQIVRDSAIADLDRSAPYAAARLVWPADVDPETTIQRVRVWLNPDLSGDGQEVAHWKCELHALVKWGRIEASGFPSLQLAKIAEAIVPAGPAEGEVTFVFGGEGAPRPAAIWPQNISRVHIPEAYNHDVPVTFVFIYALKSDGSPAGNAGWARADANPDPEQPSGVILEGAVLLDAPSDHRPLTFADTAPVSWVPYVVAEFFEYQAATVAFTGAGNRIDLGAVPAADEVVELVAQGETPGSTAITWEVLADNGVTWVPFRDGQLTDELPGVGRRQTYHVRAHLTPSANGDLTPIARDLGARVLRRWLLDGLAAPRVTTGWAVDPRTLRGSIPEIEIDVIRDGVRDFRDFASLLASEHDPTDLEFRLWVGHPQLDRSAWLLIDTWLIDDIEPRSGRITFVCLSPLARTRVRLPPAEEIGDGQVERQVLHYSNQSLAAVYDDLLAARIALPERYRGAGVEDDVTLVSREIRDDDGKELLDAIAYLAGGSLISSQGRIKFRPMHESGAPVAVFPAEEIRQPAAPPGLRDRVAEFFVPFNWSDIQREFRSEVRSFHAAALAKMGLARIDAPDRLDERVARWIFDEQHARDVARRVTDTLGTGLIVWSFRSVYPHPHLEPGDIVLVETREFVGRDPNTDAALRGVLWARAVVVEVRDALGTDFVVWVRGYADLLSTTQVLDLIGYTTPSVTPTLDEDAGELYLHPHRNEHCESVRWVVDTEDEPTLEEVRAGQLSTLERIKVHTFAGLPVERVWVGILPYQREDGSGDEGGLVVLPYTARAFVSIGPTVTWFRIQATSPAAEAVRLVANDDGDDVALFYRTYPAGSPPPSFTRWPAVGFLPDPVTRDVQVTTPAEGAPDIILEAYAEDIDGHQTPKHVIIQFDHGAVPSGEFQLELDQDRRVWLVIQTTDPDTGSARVRLVVGAMAPEAFEALAFVDDADPSDGILELARSITQFGERIDTGIVLQQGQAIYLVGQFFRTTSTLAAAQAASRASPEIRAWRGTGGPGTRPTMWQNEYLVSRTQPALLTEQDGTPLLQFHGYILKAANVDTTTPNQAFVTLRHGNPAGSPGWEIGTRIEKGDTGDHPEIYVDALDEQPKVRLYESTTPQRVRITFERSEAFDPTDVGEGDNYVRVADTQWVALPNGAMQLQVGVQTGPATASLLIGWSKTTGGNVEPHPFRVYGRQLSVAERAARAASFRLQEAGTDFAFSLGDSDILLTLTPFTGDLDGAGNPTGAAGQPLEFILGGQVGQVTGAMKIFSPVAGVTLSGAVMHADAGLTVASTVGGDPALQFDPTIIDVTSDPLAAQVNRRFRVGPIDPWFDPDGLARFRVDAMSLGPSQNTPGGSTHASIMALDLATAHTAPVVAGIATVRTSYPSGAHTGSVMALEAFVHGGGGGSAATLRAVQAIITLFDDLDVTDAVALRAQINANAGWTGSISNAYGLYVTDIQVGVNRWAIYTDGPNPSRFGGQVLAAGGSAGAPAYSFDADRNTGIYRAGENRLVLVAAAGPVFEARADAVIAYKVTRPNTDAAIDLGTDTLRFRELYLSGIANIVQELRIDSTTGVQAMVASFRGGAVRWRFGADGTSESGGNSGNDFKIFRYSDGGSFLGTVLAISRATGVVDFAAPPTVGGVPIGGASTLAALSDVALGTLVGGDVLMWNGSAWVDAAPSGGGTPVGTGRQINAGTGLTGGGSLSANRTISINTSVVPRKGVNETIGADWTFNFLRAQTLNVSEPGGSTNAIRLFVQGVPGQVAAIVRINDSATNPFFVVAAGGTDPISIRVGGALKQVTQGAADSAGAGFRVLRVPN